MIDLRYLLLAGLCGCASPGPTYTDLQGESHRPLHVGEAVAHAVVFITVDCPIANSYAPAIRDLARGRGLEVGLGSGTVDFPELLGILEEHRYGGYFTINRQTTGDAVAEVAQAIKFLTSM